jgi:DNA-binding MarR family transcriptional regulator
MKQNQIDLVRRFNRAVTQRIGALDDAYLSRGRSLGLSRLLWEIEPAGSEVRRLRARLGLDSGYFSRQLRRLEADRLVTTDPDDGDGRVRKVRLTRKGLAERAVLDSSSNELAASILTPLTERQRERLVTAMADVERLCDPSELRVRRLTPHRLGRALRSPTAGSAGSGCKPSPRISRQWRKTKGWRCLAFGFQ